MLFLDSSHQKNLGSKFHDYKTIVQDLLNKTQIQNGSFGPGSHNWAKFLNAINLEP